ncbi:MAG: hypothetical protein HY830_18765 [Actinobacteria bacterium]|nr:hypothetical protein [Actinomycetota bacterium]
MGLSEQQEHELRAAYERRVAGRRAVMKPTVAHGEQLGRAHDLGGVPAVYVDEQPDPVATGLGAAGLLQLLAAPAAAATVLGAVQRGEIGPFPAAGLPVVLLAGAVVCGVRSWRTAPRRSWVHVFPAGLVLQDHRGAVRATRWSDVVGAEYVLDPDVPHTSVTAYRLRTRAGDVVLPVTYVNAHDPYERAGGLLRSVLPRAVAATMPGFPTLGDALVAADVLPAHPPAADG